MYKKISFALVYCLSALILSFSAAWFFLKEANFSYGFWHDHTSIKYAIDKYGAQNHFKQGFELTTKAEREALFAQIAQAIVNHGKGLADIRFEVAGHASQTLLREAEVTHLQDVANLIDLSPLLVIPALLIWLLQLGLLVSRRQGPPSYVIQSIALAGGMGLVGLVVLAIGPVKVFNQLHIWAFPSGHQWFFYYQESLMSTMMHAPILFGWIAMEWACLAVVCYGVLQILTAKGLRLWQSRAGQVEA